MASEQFTGKTVQAVERTFDVIRTLRRNRSMTVSEIAEELDLPTSTAHLHLKTLESTGYAVNSDGRYRLSLRFLRDGITLRSMEQIYNISAETVDGLARETNEVAALGVEECGQRVLLYVAEGDEAVYDNAPTGEYTNMHWTALGKAILAHLPDQRVDTIIEEYGLPAQTENTFTDRDALEGDLDETRERGYSFDDEERRDGIRSIAVPIIVDESVVGAVSVTGPKNRISTERIEAELLPTLQYAVDVIEVKYAS
jgi:DNA-binding IclR family transcriptional regulator